MFKAVRWCTELAFGMSYWGLSKFLSDSHYELLALVAWVISNLKSSHINYCISLACYN